MLESLACTLTVLHTRQIEEAEYLENAYCMWTSCIHPLHAINAKSTHWVSKNSEQPQKYIIRWSSIQNFAINLLCQFCYEIQFFDAVRILRDVSIWRGVIWLRGSTYPTMVQTAKGEPLQMDAWNKVIGTSRHVGRNPLQHKTNTVT